MENPNSLKHSYPIPDNYEFISVLGQGSYGEVIKCIKLDTNEEVAVKIPHYQDKIDLKEEASIMRNLMNHNLDEFNIIKYNGELLVDNTLSLEYEFLDITLHGYMKGLGNQEMALEDIRSIIQQIAVAFEALRGVQVIHTDVKSDNIMVVDRTKWPLRVKLIDFGVAMSKETGMQGNTVQALELRAPEVILGLPFSESIDIWSLGHVMALMMFRILLFPGEDEYDVFLYMFDLLGPPPEHLLNDGWKSEEFFKLTISDSWMLKTPEEYYGSQKSMKDLRAYTFRSLDELKKNRKKKSAEWTECIELLKAMLQWDEKDRITPIGILTHPFITQGYLKSGPSIKRLHMDQSGRKKDREIQKKEEEIMRKDEIIKRKNEQIKKMGGDIKRKDEIIKRRNDEIEKKDQEIKKAEKIYKNVKKRMDEEIKRKDEEMKRMAEKMKKDEDIKRKNEEIKRKDEQIKRMAEEIKRKDEEIKRLAEEIKEDEENKRKDEEIKRMAEKMKDDQIKMKDEEIKKMAEEIKKKDEEIKKKDEEIRRRKNCFCHLWSWIHKKCT